MLNPACRSAPWPSARIPHSAYRISAGYTSRMTGPSAILDYASPRPQGRVRLPSRSRLDVVRDRHEVTITETLSGKDSALFGVAVAVVTLAVLPAVMYALGAALARRRQIDWM